MSGRKCNRGASKRDSDSEIVNMFPAIPRTPAVPASQQASCSLPNELFTSTAVDQNLTSKPWLAASILPDTLRIFGFFAPSPYLKKQGQKHYYSYKHFSFLSSSLISTTRMPGDCVSLL